MYLCNSMNVCTLACYLYTRFQTSVLHVRKLQIYDVPDFEWVKRNTIFYVGSGSCIFTWGVVQFYGCIFTSLGGEHFCWSCFFSCSYFFIRMRTISTWVAIVSKKINPGFFLHFCSILSVWVPFYKSCIEPGIFLNFHIPRVNILAKNPSFFPHLLLISSPFFSAKQ